MTPGCTAEACNLRDNYKRLRKEGYEVLGVSTDSEASHRKFIEKEKLPFRLLADTDKSLHQQFGTWVEKSMYGRKYMGTARTTFILDEAGRISRVIDKVDTRNHTEQILGGIATAGMKSAKKAKGKSLSRKGPSVRKK
jgi:peroxiredoxin Q/BCP